MRAAGASTATTSSSTATTADLCSFPGIELCKTGTWDASTGATTITRADLASAIAAARSLPDPVLKIGHQDPRFDGEPAVGRIANLRLADRGDTLLGDLVDVPGWLADSVVTAYPQRSIEATFNYQTNGKTYRFVLTGLALLGAQWPAVTDLNSLRKLLEKAS